MKSTYIKVIFFFIFSWLLLPQNQAFSQQLYTLKKSNGAIEQAPVKEVTLTFDNNGSLTQSRNGIKKSILFSSVNLICFASKINIAPNANSGPDRIVNEGTIVFLNGNASNDPVGSALTYTWTAPEGITLSSNHVSEPSFRAPDVAEDTHFTISLIVSNGTLTSTVDQVLITVKNINKAPLANAGLDQSVNEGATATLDGSLSSDPDGNPLTYKWTAPAGITLSSTTVAKPTFTAPEVTANTNFTFTLVVNDGTVDSPPATKIVTVLNVIKVGISSVENSLIKIYPNPTTGIIKIEGLPSNQKTKIAIQTVDGKLIRKKTSNSMTEIIDISDQVSGTYLLFINKKIFKIIKK